MFDTSKIYDTSTLRSWIEREFMSNVMFILLLAVPATTFLLFAFIAVKYFFQQRRSEIGLDEIVPFLRHVNISVFADYINPLQETYSRHRYTRQEFRAMQLKHTRILIETTKRIIGNTSFLQDLAVSHLYSRHALIAELSESLIRIGTDVRLHGMIVLVRLYIKRAMLALGPFAFRPQLSSLHHTVVSNLIPSYELLRSTAKDFTLLKAPGFTQNLTDNL